jgi:hypothetical protein
MLLLDLPDEIILRIFSLLTVNEVKLVIKYSNARILTLGYQRLYRQRIKLVNEHDRFYQNDYETVINLENYEKNLQDKKFLETSTNHLSISFTRQDFDYSDFVRSNFEFQELLYQYRQYFESIGRVDMYINATELFIENPFSITASIIKIFISSSDVLANNLTNLTFEDCEIGYHSSNWGNFLSKFRKLKLLAFVRCSIPSSNSDNNDILGSIKFPPLLQNLIIVDNRLEFISLRFIQNLPKSLKRLTLNDNELEDFDIPNLNLSLPNLIKLNLNGNPLRTLINYTNFTSSNFYLGLLRTHINGSMKLALLKHAEKIGFTVYGLNIDET